MEEKVTKKTAHEQQLELVALLSRGLKLAKESADEGHWSTEHIAELEAELVREHEILSDMSKVVQAEREAHEIVRLRNVKHNEPEGMYLDR